MPKCNSSGAEGKVSLHAVLLYERNIQLLLAVVSSTMYSWTGIGVQTN